MSSAQFSFPAQTISQNAQHGVRVGAEPLHRSISAGFFFFKLSNKKEMLLRSQCVDTFIFITNVLNFVPFFTNFSGLEYLEFDRLVVPSIDELLKLRVPNLRYLLFHYYPKLRSESQNMNSHKTFQVGSFFILVFLNKTKLLVKIHSTFSV